MIEISKMMDKRGQQRRRGADFMVRFVAYRNAVEENGALAA
jgi:hypothetical protein